MTDNPNPDLKPHEILTPPCRLAFPALFGAKPNHPTTPEKKSFQATILIPPTVGPKMFALAIQAAMMAKWKKAISLEGNSMPLKPVTTEGWAGWYKVKAKSQFMPGVVDQAKRPILPPGGETNAQLRQAAEQRVFAGCWCRFYVSAWAWDNKAGRGISFNLNSVQLHHEDQRFDGRRSADEVFGVLDDLDPTETTPPGTAGAVDLSALFGGGAANAAAPAGGDDALARLLG